MSRRISRSTFLKAGAGVVATAATGKFLFDFCSPTHNIPCRMLGPSMSAGHMLRDHQNPADSPAPARKTRVVIIGGGVAGLSAGWWLKKNGFEDFLVLEMEKDVGGNSAFGKNDYSAYPWGAHYIPLANEESVLVKQLFEELGIIQGYDQRKLPIYNEMYLCHEPQERLFKDGSFQEGLVPKRGLQSEDRREMARFFKQMEQLRSTRGSDGKPPFAIPIALSSQDPEFVALDGISMQQWMEKNKYTSKPLRWYVNYCCRDDYGASIDTVSAWAGLHYFAGRNGHAANCEHNSVVTWPEGNGFIINKLKEKLSDKIITNAFTTAIAANDKIKCTYVDPQSYKAASVQSELAVFAAPRFLAKHIIQGYADQASAVTSADLAYAPWLVANITLKKIPSCEGLQVCWDNVSYYSDSLGYVLSSHQSIVTRQGPTVITYYYPLSETEPRAGRQLLLEKTAKQWSEQILKDLEQMHPGITSQILAMDMWPWGHGMIRPSPGFIWGEKRKQMAGSFGNLFFAHSDMSGISNFEEAQYHGVQAAQQILQSVCTT